MYSTQEAADALGVSTGRIRQLINNGQLEAVKTSEGWFITQAAIDERRQNMHVGRPKKSDEATQPILIIDAKPANFNFQDEEADARAEEFVKKQTAKQAEMQTAKLPSVETLTQAEDEAAQYADIKTLTQDKPPVKAEAPAAKEAPASAAPASSGLDLPDFDGFADDAQIEEAPASVAQKPVDKDPQLSSSFAERLAQSRTKGGAKKRAEEKPAPKKRGFSKPKLFGSLDDQYKADEVMKGTSSAEFTAKMAGANLYEAAVSGSKSNFGHQAFVQFRDVRKVYQMGEVEVAAVDGMTFDIEEGEFVCVVGPSGAGKTTLLNMLGGMDDCTSGTIMLAGREISAMTERELTLYRRFDIGFVFQFYNLVQNLTALENVELAAQIEEDPLDASFVMDLVGLGHRKNNFPSQLSGGEQQRVAIARALAKNPKLLLCDEPTGALDYQTGKAILSLLQETCHATGKTVIIITHNQAFEAIADRVIRVREGRVASVELNDNPADAMGLEW